LQIVRLDPRMSLQQAALRASHADNQPCRNAIAHVEEVLDYRLRQALASDDVRAERAAHEDASLAHADSRCVGPRPPRRGLDPLQRRAQPEEGERPTHERRR
jgi:hypothetical protein